MKNGFYKIGFWFLVVGLLVGGAFWGGQYYLKSQMADNEAMVVEVTASPTPERSGVTKVPEAGKEATATPTVIPTVSEEDLVDTYAGLFAEKFSKPEEDAKVTISKTDENHVAGGIVFEGEMGGGWFLGAKKNGEWVIVADGNGTVPCDKIEPYNFSTAMVPECWDDANSKLIKR